MFGVTNKDHRFCSLSLTPNRSFCSTEQKEEVKTEPSKEEKKEKSKEDFLISRREEERRERIKEAKRTKRISMKMKSMVRDYKELWTDLKNREYALMYWKAKKYLSRNFKKLKLFMRHIWIEIKKIGKGFRRLKEDVSFSIKTTKDTTFKEYGQYTFQSRIRIRQTWSDLFKFIPFSIFILIPGLELLLPAWLIIFPNAIPSQFQSDTSKSKKLDDLVEKQKTSSKKLMKLFPQRLAELVKDREVLEEDKERIEKLRSLLKDPDVLTTDLLEYRDIFGKYLGFDQYTPKVLLAICHLVALEPVTGVNTLNNIIKIFKTKVEIDHPAVAWFTTRILKRELRMYMKKLRNDDTMIKFSEIEEMDEATLNRVCFERGIPISIFNRNQKLRELKKWYTLSNLKNVSDTLLLYCRLFKFSNIKSSHDQFTDEYQILRRCPNEIYFYEKQKMYEETLAVDELKLLVELLNYRRNVTKEDPKFTSEELESYANLLKSLKHRFTDLYGTGTEDDAAEQLLVSNSINAEIEMTFRLGNKVIDYMENCLIIKHFMEQKQDELEKDYPELAEKAKEIFGNEFYYSFPHDKQKLEEEPSWEEKLHERKDEIERKLYDTVKTTISKNRYVSA